MVPPLHFGWRLIYDLGVLTTSQIVSGLVAGCVLIVFGLVPGPFQRLSEGVRNFSSTLYSPFPHHARRHAGEAHQPVGLAVLGVAMLLLTMLGWLAGPF